MYKLISSPVTSKPTRRAAKRPRESEAIAHVRTPNEYLKYLTKTFEPKAKKQWTEDNTIYLFQGFMHDNGGSVHKVFDPLPDSKKYLTRINQLYKISAERTKRLLESGAIPGYFHSEGPKKALSAKEKREITAIGETYIKNLKALAKSTKYKPLQTLMATVDAVVVLGSRNKFNTVTKNKKDPHLAYYRISDAMDRLTKDPFIRVLGEAYYSIANDYLLGYYFSWPQFQKQCKTDVFKPVFDMWARGLHSQIVDDTLYIFME